MHASDLKFDPEIAGQLGPARPRLTLGRTDWMLCLAAAALAVALRMSGADVTVFHLINAPAAQAATMWSMLSVAGLGLSALLLCLLLMPGPTPANSAETPVNLAPPTAALLGGLLLCFPIGGGVTHLFKALLSLPRPGAVLPAGDLVVIGDALLRHSMPSGHAVTAFAMAGLLLRCFGFKGASRWAVLGVAAAIACSRVSTSAHWPSDVLAGAALGWLIAPLALHLAQRMNLIRWLSGHQARWPMAVSALIAAYVMATLNTGYPLARPLQWVLAAMGVLAALRQTGLLHAPWRALTRPSAGGPP